MLHYHTLRLFSSFDKFLSIKCKSETFKANQLLRFQKSQQYCELSGSSYIFLHLSFGTRSTLLICLSPVLIRSKNSSPALTTQLAPLRLVPLHKSTDENLDHCEIYLKTQFEMNLCIFPQRLTQRSSGRAPSVPLCIYEIVLFVYKLHCLISQSTWILDQNGSNTKYS